MKKGTLKKSIALCCSITMLATSIPFTAINIKAATGDFFDEKNNTIKHLQYTPMGYIMSLQMRNRNRLAGK